MPKYTKHNDKTHAENLCTKIFAKILNVSCLQRSKNTIHGGSGCVGSHSSAASLLQLKEASAFKPHLCFYYHTLVKLEPLLMKEGIYRKYIKNSAGKKDRNKRGTGETNEMRKLEEEERKSMPFRTESRASRDSERGVLISTLIKEVSDKRIFWSKWMNRWMNRSFSLPQGVITPWNKSTALTSVSGDDNSNNWLQWCWNTNTDY